MTQSNTKGLCHFPQKTSRPFPARSLGRRRGKSSAGRRGTSSRRRYGSRFLFPAGSKFARCFLYSFEEGAGATPRSSEESYRKRRAKGVLCRKGSAGVSMRMAGDQMQTGSGGNGREMRTVGVCSRRRTTTGRKVRPGKTWGEVRAGGRAGLTLVFPPLLLLQQAFEHRLR